MKNRISISKKTGWIPVNLKIFCIPLIMIALAFINSAYATVPQVDLQKENNLKDKKIDLLEKLENGKSITSEDIFTSYGKSAEDICILPDPDLPQIPESPCIQDLHSFRKEYFYNGHNGKEELFESDMDMREVHEKLSRSIDDLRKEIESFRNSKDFEIIRNGFMKWSNELRKEIEKIRVEVSREAKEIRNKESVHSFN